MNVPGEAMDGFRDSNEHGATSQLIASILICLTKRGYIPWPDPWSPWSSRPLHMLHEAVKYLGLWRMLRDSVVSRLVWRQTSLERASSALVSQNVRLVNELISDELVSHNEISLGNIADAYFHRTKESSLAFHDEGAGGVVRWSGRLVVIFGLLDSGFSWLYRFSDSWAQLEWAVILIGLIAAQTVAVIRWKMQTLEERTQVCEARHFVGLQGRGETACCSPHVEHT